MSSSGLSSHAAFYAEESAYWDELVEPDEVDVAEVALDEATEEIKLYLDPDASPRLFHLAVEILAGSAVVRKPGYVECSSWCEPRIVFLVTAEKAIERARLMLLDNSLYEKKRRVPPSVVGVHRVACRPAGRARAHGRRAAAGTRGSPSRPRRDRHLAARAHDVARKGTA